MISLPRPRFLRLWLGCAGLAVAAAPAQAQADAAQRWAFATLSTSAAGDILSSPAIAPDGTIYIGIEIGTAASANPSGRLFAVRPDGSEAWSFAAPDWIDATPAVGVDGTVYFGCWDGELYALRPDGSLKWATTLGAYISASPAIGADGVIYTGTGDGDLHAVNPDGTIRWTFSVADWIDASPVIGVDGTIYFGSWDASLYALRPDGTEKWRFTAAGEIVGAPAIGPDGTVYFGSRDLHVYAVRPDGTLRWTLEFTDGIESSPALAPDGTILVTTTGGRLIAVTRDGAERWRYPAAGQPPLNPIYSSPAVRGDGSIVFGSSDEGLYVVDSNGALRLKAALGDWADSSPVITADGSIYIGCSDKRLYAFDGAAAPALTAWPQYRRNEQRDARQPVGAVAGTNGRLVNLSVRTMAGTGANTLIVGFYVAGGGSQKLLVRGVGPTLSQFSVAGPLPNPVLTAYTGTSVMGQNDNWGAGPDAALISSTSAMVGAFPLPAGSDDAVLLHDFAAGGYTVHVNDATAAAGIALVELYDAGGQAGVRLGNASARSAVLPGEGVLTAGFVINDGTRAMMVRGIGPALAAFGVEGALADTRLRVFRGSQLVAANDDWDSGAAGSAIAVAAQSVGAFSLPAGSRDAVLLLTLPPGAYTAQVSGANGTSGVGMVEIFELP